MYLHSLWNRPEKLAKKACPFIDRTNKLDMCRQCIQDKKTITHLFPEIM